MKRLLMAFTLALIVISGAAAQNETAVHVSQRRTLEINGVGRVYSIYVPETLHGPAPLIVALHGRFSSGKAFEAMTHLSERADENGWIVAYPQAYQYSWEDGGRESGVPRLGDSPQDDTAFIDGMITAISGEHEISTITLAGFDTGGDMAERLLCKSEHPIDAALLAATVAWSYSAAQCEGKTVTTDLLFVYGAYDQIYAALGSDLTDTSQPDGSPIRYMGSYETVEFWAAQAGCAAAPEQDGLLTRFVGCAGEAQVAAILMGDLSHEWPRAGAYTETGGVADRYDGGALLTALLADSLPVDVPASVPTPPTPRTFVAYVPTTYTGDDPLPVIVGLHGRTDTGSGFAAITDFTRIAEQEGFIAIFPDGLNNQWSYLSGIMSGALYNQPDDVAFLNALVDDLALDLNIDLSRVYLTGFSNGGFMTYRMACNPEPNRFAAYGVAGALLYPEMEQMCATAPLRPILVEHGTEDPNIQWAGITHMPKPGTVVMTRTVLQSVSFFAARNGCVDAGGERTNLPPSDTITSVVRFDFAHCDSGKSVRFFAVVHGGHNWPGLNILPPEIAGKVNLDINLSREVWAFFRQYHLDE